VINATQPASDKIFDTAGFEKFLHDKIKVDGRTGNLGDVVQISQEGEGKIIVVAHTQFSGRYLKYLYVLLFRGRGKTETKYLIAPRNSSRRTCFVTGFVSFLPPRVSTSSASSMSLMTVMTRTRSKWVAGYRLCAKIVSLLPRRVTGYGFVKNI
jgi:hypothetical protein